MEGYRLSPQQKRNWLIQQADPDGRYYAQVVAEIPGVPSVPALWEAVTAVSRRHEVLRTVLQLIPGADVPFQVIRAEPLLTCVLHDLRGRPETEWTALRDRQAATPFDLHCGPLLRADLVRLAEDRSRLLLTLPATSADIATLHQLMAEVCSAYAGEVFAVPDEDVLQYVDVAEWQNDVLTADETTAGRAYWRERVSLLPRIESLPFERGRAQRRPFRPASLSITVDLDLATSPSAVFLTAWQTLLCRLQGDDVRIALGGENRRHEEMQQAIGAFAQWLPYRSHVPADATLSTALESTTEQTQEMLRHQEFFDAAAAEGEPIANLAFAWTETEPNVRWPATFYGEPFSLLLSGVESGSEVRLALHYDTARVTDDDARRLADMYVCLLTSAVRRPDAKLTALPLAESMAPAPRDARGESERRCIHALFEEQASLEPDRAAVVAGRAQLSYGELNEQANQVAHRLRHSGVTTGMTVGLLGERSVDLLVGLLGILKAGAAYVPLDPGLPTERLNSMLAQTDTEIVVADSGLLDRLPPKVTAFVLRSAALATEPTGNPRTDVTPEHLAYVIFTSGSTGEPKGVGVSHANLYDYTDSIVRRLDLPARAVYASVSTFAADLGHTVVYPALVTGGLLHLISQECANDPGQFTDYLRRHPIDCLKIVPSHLRAMLEAPRPESVLPAGWLVLGGEEPAADMVRHIHALAPDLRIMNHYGPTETTVGVLTHIVDPTEESDAVPLGRPLPHAQVHVVDEELRPAAVWVGGEIYIGGSSVAMGYLGQPGLTAERFAPDPFSEEPGARLYRTGDRARRLTDGTLVFLGRTDHQIQIRGFRVELGEIETVLRTHPDITDATVIHTNQLIAYVVTDLATTELRDHVIQHLPDHMVPAHFVRLDHLPLTPNGKIDIQQLPAYQLETRYAPPRTPTEHTLATIWAQVLGIPRVGRDDNFFALGGDSILTIQTVARAAQAGITLTPPQLFQHQTIATLTPTLTATTNTAPQTPTTGPVHPTPIQRWFLDQKLPNPHHYNQALLLQTHQPLDAQALDAALHALHTHHDTLRLRIHNDTLDNAPPSDPPTTLLSTGIQSDFDLSSGRLLRAVHLAHQHQLLLTAHHLAVDGVSWRILLEDLTTAYHQAATHQSIQLPPKTTSYQAWAQHLVDHANDDEIAAQVPHWTRVMQAVKAIPKDRPADPAANTFGDAETVSVRLDADATRRLLRADTQELLLTALGQTLTRWIGCSQIVIDTESHGRLPLTSDVDLSRTVGWFTALHPVAIPNGPQLPDNVLGYGILRYLRSDSSVTELHALPSPDIRFNYLGQVIREDSANSLFDLLPDRLGPAVDPSGLRPYLLDITAVVIASELLMTWSFSPALHRRDTVTTLADECIRHLEALITRSATRVVEADLDEEDLGELIDQLDGLLTAEGET
ncbi:MAG: amino acid adenylation domain protein [Actinomycetia bacterium]|nr:amino acid adenylation domain protein [Actinomycetes bacterium]